MLAAFDGGATQVEERLAMGSFASWTTFIDLSFVDGRCCCCGNFATVSDSSPSYSGSGDGLLEAFLSGISSEHPRVEEDDDKLFVSVLMLSFPDLDPRVKELMRWVFAGRWC